MNYFTYGIIISCLFLSSCGNLKVKNISQEVKEKKITFIRPVEIFPEESQPPIKRNKIVKIEKNKVWNKKIVKKSQNIIIQKNEENLNEKKSKSSNFSNLRRPFFSKKNKTKKKEMKLSYPENIYNHWMNYYKGKNRKTVIGPILRW